VFVFLKDELGNLLLGQEISMFLVRMGQQGIVLPQFRSQVSVGRSKGIENSLDEVTHGTGVTGRARVAIINSCHVQEFLSSRRRNESSTARGWNQTHADGSTLSSDLARNGMGKSRTLSPVSASYGSDIKLGGGDGTTNGSSDFTRALDSKSNVSSIVSNSDKGLESGTLTSRRLLLDGHDLHDLVLKLVLELNPARPHSTDALKTVEIRTTKFTKLATTPDISALPVLQYYNYCDRSTRVDLFRASAGV
jgi:hypothetical protein